MILQFSAVVSAAWAEKTEKDFVICQIAVKTDKMELR